MAISRKYMIWPKWYNCVKPHYVANAKCHRIILVHTVTFRIGNVVWFHAMERSSYRRSHDSTQCPLGTIVQISINVSMNGIINKYFLYFSTRRCQVVSEANSKETLGAIVWFTIRATLYCVNPYRDIGDKCQHVNIVTTCWYLSPMSRYGFAQWNYYGHIVNFLNMAMPI